jgi:hypothetical protein
MSEADILQSDAANVSASPMARSTPSIASVTSALQKLNINNTEYEVLKAMPNKRGTTSWVWDHGVKLKGLSPSLSKARVKYRWMCRRCFEKGEHVTYAASTTSHAMNHLRDTHRLDKDGPISTDTNIQSASEDVERSSFDFGHFKDLLIRWIVIMHISFSQVENEVFRSLLLYLSIALVPYLPTSGTTIRNWVMDDFKQRRKQIKKMLHLSKSLIHFSFDMWTSPNCMGMIAVIAHFVSHTGEARDCLIGLRRVHGSHSGENMAHSIISVIEEYELRDRLGYFVLDNVSSNDTCVREILRKLRPDLNAKNRRLRCFGHIVNLAAKAFLFGNDPEAFEAETMVADILQQEKKALASWRKLGPIGKLHNIVTYIRKTPQRRERFSNLANDELVPEARGKAIFNI